MDNIYPAYYIRGGRSSLHTLNDKVFISQMEKMIQYTIPSFTAEGVSIQRHLRRKPDGSVDKRSFNYTVVGVELTYRQIKAAFFNNWANDKFGYPDDTDYQIKLQRFGKTTPNLQTFHDALKTADGITCYDEIPVISSVVEDSNGLVKDIQQGLIKVPKSVQKLNVLQKCKGFHGFVTAPKSFPPTTEEFYHARFDSKLHAYNAAYELVYGEGLFENISSGNVVKVVNFTTRGKSFFDLKRFATACWNCGHPITIYDISIDLDFVHAFCGCNTSRSCFLFPGEDMPRFLRPQAGSNMSMASTSTTASTSSRRNNIPNAVQEETDSQQQEKKGKKKVVRKPSNDKARDNGNDGSKKPEDEGSAGSGQGYGLRPRK